MAEDTKAAETEVSREDLEKSFDTMLKELHKAAYDGEEEGDNAPPPLPKKGAKHAEPDEDEMGGEGDEDEDDMGDEDEDEEDMGKSVDFAAMMREDPEAEAAMAVEPYLAQIVKSIGTYLKATRSEIASVRSELRDVTKLAKSLAKVTLTQAELQKSVSATVQEIAGQPQPSGSVRVLAKGREAAAQFDGPKLLQKSHEALKKGEIDLVTAEKVAMRVRRGTLGAFNDEVDNWAKTAQAAG